MKILWLIVIVGSLCHGMGKVEQRQIRELFKAAQHGNVDNLEANLVCAPSLKDYIDPRSGNTLLLVVVKRNHVNAASKLIEFEVDVNLADRQGNTPLLIAVRNGEAELIDALIQAGARIKVKNKVGQSPISMAYLHGHISLIEKFRSDFDIELSSSIDKWIDAAQKDGKQYMADYLKKFPEQKRAFFKAICDGDLQKVKAYVDEGMPLGTSFEKGNTALHYAISYGHGMIALYLLNKDARLISLKNNKGENPIDLAFESAISVNDWMIFFVTMAYAKKVDDNSLAVWKAFIASWKEQTSHKANSLCFSLTSSAEGFQPPSMRDSLVHLIEEGLSEAPSTQSDLGPALQVIFSEEPGSFEWLEDAEE